MTKQQLLNQIISQFADYPSIEYSFVQPTVINEAEDGTITKSIVGHKTLTIRGISPTPIHGQRYKPIITEGRTEG